MRYGICHLSIIPVRIEPSETSEMSSQLLFGEHFKVLEKRKEWSKMHDVTKVPLFASSKPVLEILLDFYDKDQLQPIRYLDEGRRKIGYSASMLPAVCEAWLMARDQGKLQKNQMHKAEKAETFMRGFARLGIAALVDEVTGYQYIREKNSLQQILDKFLTDEANAWTKTFPDEFWIKLIALKRQPPERAIKRPPFVGRWVNDLVYDRLAPALRHKLETINPKTEKGYRKNKHHQMLTQDHGVSELQNHLNKVMLLMDAADTEEEFYRLLNKTMPKYNVTIDFLNKVD